MTLSSEDSERQRSVTLLAKRRYHSCVIFGSNGTERFQRSFSFQNITGVSFFASKLKVLWCLWYNPARILLSNSRTKRARTGNHVLRDTLVIILKKLRIYWFARSVYDRFWPYSRARLLEMWMSIQPNAWEARRRMRAILSFSSEECANTNIKVFTYKLPREYRPTASNLPSCTYYAIKNYFEKCVATDSPEEADFFFVPLNLIEYQQRSANPKEVLRYLKYLSQKKNHILVSTFDGSNRTRKNHFYVYSELYDWLDDFILLALESTDDLIPDQDIGIIPYNTLERNPYFNTNSRIYLYSFLGAFNYYPLPALPSSHIRNKLKYLPHSEDVYIGTKLSDELRSRLSTNYPALSMKYPALDDFELMSRNSVFTLCPAGYGRWTYRFFQAIQWGSIPVLLSDNYIKPFRDFIPYDDFSVTIEERHIGELDKILRSLPEEKISQYQEQLRINQQLFTPKMFFSFLCKTLEDRRVA